MEPSRSEPRLSREEASLVRDFLRLNRRRIRADRPLSALESARWEQLRRQIEQLLSEPGRAPGAVPGAVRRALRVPADLEVRYSDREREVLASASEIAERGLFLATDSPPPVGTPLHLKLTGDRGETIKVAGAVVWIRRRGEPGGPPGIGVEFANLDQAQREAVAYLVEQALAAL